MSHYNRRHTNQRATPTPNHRYNTRYSNKLNQLSTTLTNVHSLGKMKSTKSRLPVRSRNYLYETPVRNSSRYNRRSQQLTSDNDIDLDDSLVSMGDFQSPSVKQMPQDEPMEFGYSALQGIKQVFTRIVTGAGGVLSDVFYNIKHKMTEDSYESEDGEYEDSSSPACRMFIFVIAFVIILGYFVWPSTRHITPLTQSPDMKIPEMPRVAVSTDDSDYITVKEFQEFEKIWEDFVNVRTLEAEREQNDHRISATEIGDLREQLNSLQIHIGEADTISTASNEEINLLSSKSEEMSQKLSRIDMEFSNLAQKVNSVNVDALSALELKIDKLQKQIRHFASASSEKTPSISAADQFVSRIELESLSGKVAYLQTQLSEIRVNHGDLVSDFAHVDSAVIQNELQNFEEVLRQFESRISLIETTKHLTTSQQASNVASSDYDDLIKTFDELRGKQERLVEKQTWLELENKQLHEQLRSHNTKIIKMDLDYESRFTNIEGFGAEVSHLKNQIDEKTARFANKLRYLEGRSVIDQPGDIITTVEELVDTRLEQYSADKTNEIDYALASAGGIVIGTSGEFEANSRSPIGWIFKLIDRVLNPQDRSKRVITADMRVGNCFPLSGSQGFVDIRLAKEIAVRTVSLEHISAKIAPNYGTTPRAFQVKGLRDEEWDLLGSFEYVNDGRQLQSYEVKNDDLNGYAIVRLEVLSNYGSPEYTCIYRFRVHGILLAES